ncbi:hypothetical protein BLOT_009638 [Blomia tropicalis]|nr:hypothetical protein BLOT_009638 [Blomia tropicalis]
MLTIKQVQIELQIILGNNSAHHEQLESNLIRQNAIFALQTCEVFLTMSFLWPQIISSRRFVESALHLDTFVFNLVEYSHFLHERLFHKSQIRKI